MRHFLILLVCIGMFQSCRVKTDDDVSVEIDCPTFEEISHNRYTDFPYQDCKVTDYTIIGNSLRLSLALSGCNFQRNFRFLVDESKSKSMPPQQDAKLVFDPQSCQAFFEFEICFDISGLSRPTVLNLPYTEGIQAIEIN